MAFAFINATSVNSASSSSLVCNKPTNTAQNDIMFALVSQSGAGGYPNSVPSGWASLGQNHSVSFNELFWKSAGGSEPGDYTWGFAGSQQGRVTIVTYRDGFATSSPIDVVSNTAYTTNNATFRAASMSVTATGSPLIFFATGVKTFAINYTKPSVPTTDWAENFDGGAETSDMWVEVASMVWSGSGATGDMDATGSDTPESGNKHAFAVALAQPVSVTVSPTVITTTFTVQAPVITAGATVGPAVVTMTISVQSPTVTTVASDWANGTKNTSIYTNETKNSSSWGNESKSGSSWTNQNKN